MHIHIYMHIHCICINIYTHTSNYVSALNEIRGHNFEKEGCGKLEDTEGRKRNK